MVRLKSLGGLLRKKSVLLSIVVLIGLAGVAFWQYNVHNNKKNLSQGQGVADVNQAANDNIKMFKNSQKPEDQAALINAYLNTQQYDKARDALLSIAKKSGKGSDYVAVIRVCSVYKVSNKSECISSAQEQLAKQVSNLSFTQAYTAGTSLEDANFKKEAIIYFQRALDVYPSTTPDEYIDSKDKLKDHINELQK
jgi:tetratricopeptide (TPR) repeat protein